MLQNYVVEGAGTTTSAVSSSQHSKGDIVLFNALAQETSNNPDSNHNSA
jgi:hypothetical protein